MAKIELSLSDGVLVARSIPELIKKIELEIEFWSVFSHINAHQLNRSGYNTPHWVTKSVALVQELANFWPNRLEAAKSIRSVDDDAFKDLKAAFEAAQNKPPHSTSIVAQAALKLLQGSRTHESVALLVGFLRPKFSEVESIQHQQNAESVYVSMAGSLGAFLDVYSGTSLGSEELRSTSNSANVAEKLTSELGILVEGAYESRAMFLSSFESTSEMFLTKLKRLRASEVRYFRKARTDERERREKQARDFVALMETFNAHLRLKRPVELWRERHVEHNTASQSAWRKFLVGSILLAGFAGVVAFFLGGIIAASFNVPGCEIGTEPQCSRLSAQGPLNISLLLVVTTTWLWYLRLQMRIFLSERHLTLDARERMAFAETYLSLLKGAEITRDQETVVLQALMRPTQDGIIKDENGPDFALSGLLAKALEGRSR